MKNIFSFFKKDTPLYKPALFLHIQKTAGVSIIQLMQNYYGKTFPMHADFIDKKIEDLKKERFISGHMGYSIAKELMENRFSFTFLREPRERIISLYYFCRSMNPEQWEIYKLCSEMSFADFLNAAHSNPLIKLHIWNHQTWQLAEGFTENNDINDNLYQLEKYTERALIETAKTHLSEFSYVGLTSTANEDMKCILTALGIKKPEVLTYFNKSTHPHYEDLPANQQKMLDQLTELDWELYRHAQAIRQRYV